MWSKDEFTDPPTKKTLDNGLIVSTGYDKDDGYDFFQAIVMDHKGRKIESFHGHDYNVVYEDLVAYLENYKPPSSRNFLGKFF
ncbi:hypothetical protein BO94DRAFT_587014 [Aspergillus sclerotioniger CBS 115572]|uniref:Uncharacterized protein n=1 Tax=Aspergillus sclerotioniger CBS 115572 TaxID=1450535 RepID=A0A317WA74_9EURO|nr:hypothetical protein BO94DRAFT_587014 [Aspergillus sclerotioniger CBS 115572]PWY83109.1 hypothetical protein BO94DRAFT_587014 [Aspergillus sclerotioniger CBS 115572]